ncbi:MAG: hypothetical protein ACREQQ_12395, partial [Candidatus Binatia bacterium]
MLSGILLGGQAAADVTVSTPYPYDDPPTPGTERGTYTFNGTGSAGPDCAFSIVGTAKFLPNADSSGG